MDKKQLQALANELARSPSPAAPDSWPLCSCQAYGTMSNQAHLTLIHSLVKTNAFNLYTLTDVELAHRLDVDERTIRKWKSGQCQRQ